MDWENCAVKRITNSSLLNATESVSLAPICGFYNEHSAPLLTLVIDEIGQECDAAANDE